MFRRNVWRIHEFFAFLQLRLPSKNQKNPRFFLVFKNLNRKKHFLAHLCANVDACRCNKQTWPFWITVLTPPLASSLLFVSTGGESMEVPEWARGAPQGVRPPPSLTPGGPEFDPRSGVDSRSLREKRYSEKKERTSERSSRGHRRDYYRGDERNRRSSGSNWHRGWDKAKGRKATAPQSEDASKRGRSAVKSGDTRSTESVPVVLSKTEGVAAVSTWKAREEIASLLESKADPNELVATIRAGVEGRPYRPDEKGDSHLRKTSPWKAKSALSNQSPRSRSSRRDLDEELAAKFETSREEQEFILSGGVRKLGLPEWTEGSPAAAIRFEKRALPPKREDATLTAKYAAKAFLPPEESLQKPLSPSEYYESSESERGEDDPLVEQMAEISFEKKARDPLPHELEVKEEVVKPTPRLGGGGGRSKSEMEQLEKYKVRALAAFERLVVAKVRMDLVDLVFDETKDPPLDASRFALHTEPKSPSTGLRYVRMLERLLDYFDGLEEKTEDSPVSKQVVTTFIEKLIRDEAGFRTPQSVMYALDFFGVVFGFQRGGSGWDRCLKLAGTYASKRPPRTGADFLSPEVLEYLEDVVLNSEKSPAARLVAGRLRLCCQASVRHSDLVRTRLRDVEWCRDKGQTSVRGLRARVRKTKSGPRPWVASFLGVTDKGDRWMPVLMGLLLEYHGASWRTHEFIGPKAASDSTFLGEPTTLQDDVFRLKVLMRADLEDGVKVPFDESYIERFRFHGCKATMVTYMQHFGVKAKTVRHAGAWAKQADSMPDLYLRESQLLVLKAQEECLSKLRSGRTVTPLEGLPIGGVVPAPFGAEESGEKPGPPVVRAEGFEAMAVPVLESKDLQAEFRDDMEEQEAILESESKLATDEETVLSLLESQELGDSSDDEDPGELDQDLFEFFLLNKTGKGKIHKASGDGVDLPLCGIRSGGLHPVMAFEALSGSSSLCIRCFGRMDAGAKCETMCSYKKTVNGVSLRCGRRCILSCSSSDATTDRRVHSCLLHSFKQIEEEVL